MKNKTSAIVITTAVLGTLLIGGTTASAQTTGTSQTGGWGGRGGAHMERAPGVRGTVTSVSGNIITITSKGFGQNAVATTYTVDATSATFMKNGAAAKLADVAVGDMISAQGTLTGTNLVATTVFDGKGGMGNGRGMMGGRGGMRGDGTSSAPMIALPQGNGQPVVGGVVATVSGTTFTVSNKGGASFTVDGGSAVVTKAGASSTIANVAVGDSVVVQGTVNGSSIVATTIMDHGVVPAVSAAQANQPAQRQGFMGMLGGFFGHLFGF